MKAIIQRNQIKHFKDQPVYDDNGNPTGTTWDSLQLGIRFPDYPNLPTYGISIDTTTITTQVALKEAIKTEILALVARGTKELTDSNAARNYFDTWGWSDVEFETDNL